MSLSQTRDERCERKLEEATTGLLATPEIPDVSSHHYTTSENGNMKRQYCIGKLAVKSCL